MTDVKSIFIEDEHVPWEEADPGIQRKIMAYDDKLMVVKVKFERGAVGAIHQHSHSQISHVESGRFEIEINGDKRTLSPGDVFYVPPNIMHGAVCLEEGILIDVFSPMREDLINHK